MATGRNESPWSGDGVREGVTALAGTLLNAGLYLPDLTPVQLDEAVAIAREAGALGVSVFEMDGLTDEHLSTVRSGLSV
ncbi:MAG: hypothetical protein HN396_00160 [Gemmatimonadales bacterium]|jgi:hypothetical protein|nr:hypothetical protein [Gemmatimonadales bacterium]MBT3497994.1 hypothetical protein [Gemmatimonadales bacterium]MBT3774905.1 hypothetical protein [Gemmatimonadales bacterium]MBT3959421.1 hypothetical protein [Gemmatimonadales bacterium]MBT4189152.1 hypothetical protein [Gemmatimonadales bacterium]